MFAAGWLIGGIWINYYNSPVVVTFQPVETTIDQIPFPAITSNHIMQLIASCLHLKKVEKFECF